MHNENEHTRARTRAHTHTQHTHTQRPSLRRPHMQFALYYSLPTLSVKGCCYHLLANDVKPGFSTSIMRHNHMQDGKNVGGL